MLNIQKFIKENANWKALLEAKPYALRIKQENALVLFNYTQGVSDPNLEIVKEARGLVLEEGTWSVVRYGFKRFFNLGEGPAAPIDWASAIGYEKLDGSLIFVYYYNGWRVGTRGTINAEESENASGKYKNFRDLFNIAAAQYNWNWDRLNPNWTYCFELTTPFNREVVEYKDFALTLLMVRDNVTLKEVTKDTAWLRRIGNFLGVPIPMTYHCSDEKGFKTLVEQLDDTHEGIVVMDKYGNRVKIKTEHYFYVHYLASNHNFSPKKIFKIIRAGEQSEILTYFPQYKEDFNHIEELYRAAATIVENIYIVVEEWKKEHPSAARYEFVKYATNHIYSNKLMLMAYDEMLWDFLYSSEMAFILNYFPFILNI